MDKELETIINFLGDCHNSFQVKKGDTEGFPIDLRILEIEEVDCSKYNDNTEREVIIWTHHVNIALTKFTTSEIFCMLYFASSDLELNSCAEFTLEFKSLLESIGITLEICPVNLEKKKEREVNGKGEEDNTEDNTDDNSDDLLTFKEIANEAKERDN